MTVAARVELPVDAFRASLLRDIVPVPEVEAIATGKAVGRVVAAAVRSPIHLPPFDLAAMDGFGIAAADLSGGTLTVRPRGASATAAGSAVPLFTGAPVPAGVAAIVRRERTQKRGGDVVIDGSVELGADIRRAGEDVRRGDQLLAAGTIIGLRHIPVLYASGIRQVPVRRRVRVTILSTGDELRSPGQPLGFGEVYDANRPMLAALMDHPQIEIRDAGLHRDDPVALAAVLAETARDSDLLLCSGGTAGSEVDPVPAAVRRAGGIAFGYRLALKPGRPIVTGRLGKALFLGLPGSPFAAFVAAQLFARPLAFALAGAKPDRAPGETAVLAHDLLRTPGRTEFLPVDLAGRTAAGDWLVAARAARSTGVGQLAGADGLIELTGPEKTIAAGSRVALHRNAIG